MKATNGRGNVGAVLFQKNPPDQLEISPETQVKESLPWAETAPSVELYEAVPQICPNDGLPTGFYYIHPDDPNSDAISDCYDDDRGYRVADLEEAGVLMDREALNVLGASLRDLDRGGLSSQALAAPALPDSGTSALAEVVRQVIREEANGPIFWPVVPIWEVIEDFEVQLKHEGCSAKTLKKYRQVWIPFVDHFEVFPSEWQAVRAFLNETAGEKGWSSGNESRNQANLSNLYGYASCTRRGSKSGMKRDGRPVLPFNPMEGVGLPDFESAEPNPLSIEEQHRVNELKMNLRDRCIWNLEFGHGWRPVSCEGLTADDVLEAVQRADGFILRTQKKRAGKLTTTRAPILPETLSLLEELVNVLQLRGVVAVFWGRRSEPLGEEGLYKVVKRLYERAGVRVRTKEDRNGHIPYDLRDTFANTVEEAVGPGGREVAERLMGHESGRAIELYLVNRQPQELATYSPLRRLVSGNGGERGNSPSQKQNSPAKKTEEINSLELVETGESRYHTFNHS